MTPFSLFIISAFVVLFGFLTFLPLLIASQEEEKNQESLSSPSSTGSLFA
ncbi:MAG: hypothetical protein NZL98_04785 [Anaerolineales bacterium]|nr:hypothetical protein [Anaerolineales bacterium]